MRYLHRILLYHVYGRTELGAMSQAETLAMWFSTQPPHETLPVPINFGEAFVDRMVSIQKIRARTTRIHMGGLITRLALGLIPGLNLEQLEPTYVSDEMYLDITALSFCTHIRPADSLNRYVWMVNDVKWCILPNHDASRRLHNSPLPNPYLIPRTFGGPDLPVPEDEEEAPPPSSPRRRVPRTPPTTAGPSSSTPYEQPQDALGMMGALQAQILEMQRTLTLQGDAIYYMFEQGVRNGTIQPYEGYPHQPPPPARWGYVPPPPPPEEGDE